MRLQNEARSRRGLLSSVLLGVVLACGAEGARADMRLCNQTPSRVGVAIGYLDPAVQGAKSWITEGWWNLASQTCETLLKGKLAGRFYYIYAVDYDRGGEWTGNAFLCTSDKKFTIKGVKDCAPAGFKRTGFFEVDTGDAAEWTVRLADPGEAGGANK
jgi:uncharacterized membrane protein